MNTETPANDRTMMNGKPVFTIAAKSVLNLKSGFKDKLLCDGVTFSTGTACAYSCSFCYVPSIMAKSPHLVGIGVPHSDAVIRRGGALDILRDELVLKNGKRRFPDDNDRRVCYASPLVDVAANMDLVRETIEACKLILTHTAWQIRLLSKSNLLPKVAEGLTAYANANLGEAFTEAEVHARIIFGVSTGTLHDGVARAFEAGTPLVSKRIASLHWLQDQGFRTFGMICPSLPQPDAPAYTEFADEAANMIRAEKCEHVWAEVINVRGDSMKRTVDGLRAAQFRLPADLLEYVSSDRAAWELYNRETFLAHAQAYRSQPGKLRYLTYVTDATRAWWTAAVPRGAVLL